MRTVQTITHGQKTSTDMQSKMLLLVFQDICWNSTYRATVSAIVRRYLGGRRIGACGGGMCAREEEHK